MSCQGYRSQMENAIEVKDLCQMQNILTEATRNGDIIKDTSDSLLLYEACLSNSPEIVNFVCKNVETRLTEACVIYSVENGSVDILDLLFEYDREKTTLYANRKLGWINNVNLASYLLKQGCSPFAENACGVSFWNLDMFKYYVREIGIENISDFWISYISDLIVEGDCVDVLEFMIEEGLDLNSPYNSDQESITIGQAIRYPRFPCGRLPLKCADYIDKIYKSSARGNN